MELDGIDTPFSHVLNTNYSPSTEEQHLIRDVIRGPEEQIRQLDEEISRLQAKRQALKQFVDLHRALLSPFRRLPADVWRSIFFRALPENALGLCTYTTKSSPLLPTTICRSWREIAVSTPNLWTSIHIHIPIDSSSTPDLDYITRLRKRKEGLKVWLDRSGSLPITVSLTAQIYFTDRMPVSQSEVEMAEPLRALTTEYIELLVQYSPRWRTVAFNNGVHLLDLTPLERLTTSSLSSLESFHSFSYFPYLSGQVTNIDGEHDLSLSSPLENLFTKACSLRRLEFLYDSISAATLSSLPVSWHHLTELSIIRPLLFTHHPSLCPSQLMQTLATKCHSLTTLSIVLEVDSAPQTIPHPVQWPSLQNLRVVLTFMSIEAPQLINTNTPFDTDTTPNYSTFRPFVMQIFDSITLPSLKKLSVAFNEDLEDGGNYAAQLPFEDLIQRSQCPLTHFELFRPRVVAVEAVIRVLRQLETLVLVNLGYSRLTGRERRQGLLGSYVESSEPSVGQNVASPWRKNWLSRILRELLGARLDSDVGAQTDAFAALPLCPQLEELNIGGCILDDRDALLDFAQKTRRANLRTFRADLGQPVRSDVWKIFETLQVERQDSEKMRAVQDVGGIMVDWRWDEQSAEISRSLLDAPTTDLPEEGSWWNESLWL
ncbi:hypothetical protein PM082_023273 [Marasmius tenuissimus]|nr:hypothetical protein PM082_023273 [Marasmius tenuissimus]